jgi:hypothetical protein
VTICPCCGFRFEGDLRKGCDSCGVRSVGDPLPKPERELPAYGRPLLLVAMGTVMFLGFLTETIIALVERIPVSFGFWSWVAAGETAAWRFKWIAVPVMFVVLWSGRRIYRSMMETPDRFVGLAMARRGLFASALVALTFVTLIAVTVPTRLRHRQMGIEAGMKAQAYTYDRAVLEYQARYKKLPNDKQDLYRLPDPDGSIAAALADIDASWYRPTSLTAELPTVSRRARSGAALVKVTATTDDGSSGELSFTNYELRLPGEDKIFGNDDDLIVRDGVIMTIDEARETIKPAAATARSRKP